MNIEQQAELAMRLRMLANAIEADKTILRDYGYRTIIPVGNEGLIKLLEYVRDLRIEEPRQ